MVPPRIQTQAQARAALRSALRHAGTRPPPPGTRIGLLGGSFNPPHDGHIRLALAAQRRLRLREVWFLPAVQNPLKAQPQESPEETRQAFAKILPKHRASLRVVFWDRQTQNPYSRHNVRLLQAAAPKVQFVWLAGADTFAQLPRWHEWRHLVRQIPFAVFGRRPHTHAAVCAQAGQALKHARLPARQARGLASATPPRWALFAESISPLAASRLRRQNQTPMSTIRPQAPTNVKSDDVRPSEAQQDRIKAMILESLDDTKALEPRVVPFPPSVSWAEGLIVASGTSDRHLNAMAETIHIRLKREGLNPGPLEQSPGSGWVVVDAGDWIVHLFRPERRLLYDLEGLWSFD